MVVCSLPLFFFIGQDFFPTVDAGQIRLHVRAPAGTRIEQTEKYYADVQDIIRKVIPAGEVDVMLDNMGIPNSGINLSLSDGSIMSPAEGEILVAMNESHGPTPAYVDRIRDEVRKQLPELVIWSAPADIATQVLNFGLPASIDVQIAGPLRNADANAELARKMAIDINALPGVTDLRLQQVRSTPDLRVDVDRTLAGQLGVTQRDVASDLLISLSSSSQTSPNFWLNPTNGISYSIFVQTPQYRVGSVEELTNTPIVPTSTAGGVSGDTQLLGNLATVRRGISATNLTHYQIQTTSDVHLGVRNSALGTVGGEVQKVVDKYRDQLPKGSSFQLRGQIESMHASYVGLGVGLIFAVVLVYLLMVVNFQSWLDPLIILMAVPGAFRGHPVDALGDADEPQRARADGHDHVHRRGDGELDPDDHVRQRRTKSTTRPERPRRLARGRHDAAAAGGDDGDGDDRRHAADEFGPRRGRRAERAAGPRGDRRVAVRDGRHAAVRSRRLQHAAPRAACTIESTRSLHERAP